MSITHVTHVTHVLTSSDSACFHHARQLSHSRTTLEHPVALTCIVPDVPTTTLGRRGVGGGSGTVAPPPGLPDRLLLLTRRRREPPLALPPASPLTTVPPSPRRRWCPAAGDAPEGCLTVTWLHVIPPASENTSTDNVPALSTCSRHADRHSGAFFRNSEIQNFSDSQQV